MFAQHERRLGKPLLDDREIAIDAALEKRQHGRIARRPREILQKAVAIDLLIVENNPAQRFKPCVLARRLEPAGPFGEIAEDHRGLTELSCAMGQHWHFAHLIDFGTIFRRACLAALEEIDKDRLPVGADKVEHQRRAISIARLGEAVELIFRHEISFAVSANAETKSYGRASVMDPPPPVGGPWKRPVVNESSAKASPL